MSLPVRKNARLAGWDYTAAATYFVTICCDNHRCLLGHIDDEELHGQTPVRLTFVGSIIDTVISESASVYPSVNVEARVIMPNHMHLLISMNEPEANRVLGDYVRYVKSQSTKRVRALSPEMKIWQRGYHDHIVRDEKDHSRIIEYIQNNPVKWKMDCYYQE